MRTRALIDVTPPKWVTPEIARRMADMVVMACAEAGYPDVTAHPSSLFDEVVSYSFEGAPDEVLYKAGDLVRAAFGMEANP